MKTVMKKMFCLMLVAVLMVGVMPFQAFAVAGASGQEKDFILVAADPGTWTEGVNYIHVVLDSTGNIDSAAYSALSSAASAAGIIGWTYDGYGASSGLKVADLELGDSRINVYPVFASVPCAHTFTETSNTATCTAGGTRTLTCSSCGETKTEASVALPHTEVTDNAVAATCTEAGLTEGKHCSVCGTVITAQSSVPATGHTEITTPDVAATCTTAGQTGGKHCSVCNTVTVTPVAVPALGHTPGAAATCTTPQICTVCNEQITAALGHNVVNGKCTRCYVDTQTGNVNLYIWANLYTGQVKTGSVLLDTITGLSGSEHVYQVVANNEGRIRSKIPAGYDWTGHVYYEQDPKTILTVPTTLSVASEDDAVINLYTTQKLVVARVHTNKTYAIDHTINIDGFTVGQTVTSNDVLKAVQKHYNVSSLKMYTPAEWEKVVSGKTGTVIPNYEVHGGDNIIDVYVTGSYKTTSGTTHKADSSNPKTGDEIFVPMTVLFASVSSLAVLLYLNKKRAI